ncbi:channel protein TolC [Denitratisoma sp. DHT3]|uniref:TolC family outer membrane protein n=1 Tax=Denitratisoma sp. DHT3 TaxID=1981880 RepID=UPI001198B049|nr:TolC family outer membrane protein [Denitratisoma sp. DHT3]QDX81836.1 channel protein TolC [Denitratisoma sp. DHT3]
MKNARPLLLVLSLAANAAQSEDLLAVYRDAAAYDAQFASARAGLDAGREALTQGRAGLLPSIAATANNGRTDLDYHRHSAIPAPQDIKTNYHTSGWSVSLSQPLFRWDRWAGYTQAQYRVAQAEAQFGLARQDLILRAAQAYFDVLQSEDALSAAEANKKAIGEQLEEAKRSFEVGTKTVVEVHDAQARYDLANAQEIVARNDQVVRRQQLRLLTGKTYASLKNLRSGTPLAAPQPENIDKWAEGAEQGYPGVAAAQAQLGISEQEISRQRAGHLPALDLVANRGRSSQTGAFLSGSVGPGYDTTTTTVGVQLTLPLYAGGAVSSAVDQAVALKNKAQSDLDNARRGAALQARQAYLGVSAGLSQVNALEAALKSSQSALDSNKLGFEVGVRTNIDVLNAQSQFYDTRQRLVKARLDTLVAQLRLKAAAGTLAEADLAAINALLE